MDQPIIRLGTSAFTAAGWEGSFYPEGMKPADYLSRYAKHFNSVELDNTFYRVPSKATVEGWARKTPEGFVFAAKVPQICGVFTYVAGHPGRVFRPGCGVI